jgi:plastocyanin
VSTPATPPATEPPPGTIACPRCGAAVGPEQDWCVTCGVAARTRVAPVPHWRRPIMLVAAVGALALATVAVALVSLSSSDAPPGAHKITAVTGPPINATSAVAPPAPAATIGTPTTVAPAVPGAGAAKTGATTVHTQTNPATTPAPPKATPAPAAAPTHTTAAKPAVGSVAITMKDVAFKPKQRTVKVGQTVTWTNKDDFDHNVFADSGATFKSKNFGKGGTFHYKPTATGTIKYECTIHPGMTATLKVVN